MKINVNDKEKIQNALDEVQKRCTARTIKHRDILNTVGEIETLLKFIPKKSLVGLTASIDIYAETLPKAYKYRAESTQFSLIRTTSGWFVTKIARDELKRAGNSIHICLTDEAKENIIRKYEYPM